MLDERAVMLEEYGYRLRNARNQLDEQEFDALVIFSLENLRYLAGFSGEAAYGVLTRRDLYLVTDYRFVEQAESECVATKVVCRDRDTQTLGNALAQILKECGVHAAGIEAEYVSHALWNSLVPEFDGIEVNPAQGFVERLRMTKSPWEIEQLQTAASIADLALDSLLKRFKLGMAETEAARELDYLMKRFGADDIAFPTIVGFGANSAKPHCVPSDRTLRGGDIVLIDFGAKVNGYCSDMTRTFVAGEPTEAQSRMLDAVMQAQAAALAGVKAGAHGAQLDARARQVFEAAGLEKYAGKGLGHGVGLKLHERPFLGPRCDDRLEPGWVVTVEPALYVPGYGGVRYEDLVLVQAGGCLSLSKARKFVQLDC